MRHHTFYETSHLYLTRYITSLSNPLLGDTHDARKPAPALTRKPPPALTFPLPPLKTSIGSSAFSAVVGVHYVGRRGECC